MRAFELAEVVRAIRGTPASGATATELWDARAERGGGSQPIVRLEVVVHDCFFSTEYSPEVCCLMCAVDDGIAAGISGGGGLSFTRRLTEGCPECRGRFVMPGRRRHTDVAPVAATSGRGTVS